MKILVTGGCGFIGSNAMMRFAQLGWEAVGLDNMSRHGSEINREHLVRNYALRIINADVRDWETISRLVAAEQFDAILHLAGQTAVTTSLLRPREDFEVNALATLNLLEALRLHSPGTLLLYASTNKVYGSLRSAGGVERDRRWEFDGGRFGIDENTPLDFHSPYGCSKGAGDQYVLDYARVFGLRTTSLRQSCIYGPHQCGVEDQGWVAWFLLAHRQHLPITIYGTGKQTRDVLYVDDLIALYEKCLAHPDAVVGKPLNVGGGPENTLSLLELLDMLGQLSGRPVRCLYGPERPGDQVLYVSDVRRAGQLLAWNPIVAPTDGVKRLYEWVQTGENLPSDPLARALR